MNWKRQKVLVTGATGFIGSHLTEKLVNLGARVRAFAQYNSQNSIGLLELLPEDVRKEVEIVWGDMREMESVKNASQGCAIVFHLASLVGIPYSYLHPQEVVMTNTIGALNILICSRENGIEKTVITSTSEVYGTARYVPIDENHPLQGQSPYSRPVKSPLISWRRVFTVPTICRWQSAVRLIPMDRDSLCGQLSRRLLPRH